MKPSDRERKLLEQERGDYRILLDEISNTRKSFSTGMTLTSIGNAGGSNSIILGNPSGGVLIQFKDRVIIVDPGENSLSFLTSSGFDPYKITDVIASHSHNDHIGDLTSIVSSALQLNLVANKKVNIFVSPTLVDYDNKEATRFGFTLPAFAWKGNVQALYWQDRQVNRFDGKKIDTVNEASIGDEIKVKSIPGRHSEMPVSGFIFSTPYGKFGYTGDTEYFPELIDFYQDIDVLWLNMNTLGLDSIHDREEEAPEELSLVKNHLGYMGVCKLIENIAPGTAIVSHFGSQILSYVDEIQASLRERFKSSATQIYCTHTGDKFSFGEQLSANPEVGRIHP